MVANGDEDKTSWGQYRQLMISELQRIDRTLTDLNKKFDTVLQNEITEMRIKIATLEVKIGLIGVGTGVIGAAAVEIFFRLLAR